jgi:uncharacterized protein YgiM (DUF1202 family)
VAAPAPPAPRAAPPAPALPLGQINVAAVNMRGGPSTAFEVIGRLTLGEEVQVVDDSGSGWVLVRLEGDGGEGWIARRFLDRN